MTYAIIVFSLLGYLLGTGWCSRFNISSPRYNAALAAINTFVVIGVSALSANSATSLNESRFWLLEAFAVGIASILAYRFPAPKR